MAPKWAEQAAAHGSRAWLVGTRGIHVQTKECSWNGVHTRSQLPTAKPTVDHPLDGFRSRTLRRAVEQVPAVYHMEGYAIEAKGVHGIINMEPPKLK